MNISIVGSGYVGLCTGVGFALKNNKVICTDKDENKIKSINNGIPTFYEKSLEKNLKRCLNKKMISATNNLNYAILNSDITFITVGTPSMKNGSINLNYIKTASKQIGKSLKNKKTYHLIVVKSTVLPKTTEEIIIPILEKYSNKKVGKDFGVCMNPEFLREGFALEDFLNPDRIVIGEYDKKSGDILERLYKDFKAPIIRINLRTAEMVKYASNAFLATKISFINEIGNICKKLNIDTYDVAKAMGYDKRIAPYFLNAGIGFGGSCFPKDISALINKAKDLKYEMKILNSVLDVNRKQRLLIIELLKNKIKNFKNKKIAILGLAFKAGTDDVRDSASIDIIKKLLNEKANIYAFDPKAINNMKKIIPNIKYTKNIYDALKNADACLILTDWDEFKMLTDKDFSVMKNKIIIEGRKTLDKNKVKHFEGICW
ncbi:MAG: UDP-glucose/GDP-mannose dehydrogenase family protein [Candidatus Aenigmatarchaeota archaeon]